MTDLSRFRGSFPAMVTPFKKGEIDEPTLRKFVDWQISEGTHGLVPVGTTGESPTLSRVEHERVIEIVVDQVAGRVPVIAGTGSNNTAEAIHYTHHAKAAGADASLAVVPYYNKPSQEGIYQHIKAVADAEPDLPLFIYNVPGRTVADISAETIARLFKDIPNVVGLKDASAALDRAGDYRHLCGTELILLSGEDPTALAYNATGGQGCISVTANVAPKLCAEMQNACLAGEWKEALALQDRLYPLHRAMFMEPSPGPAKYGASVLGQCEEDSRLPILPLSEDTKSRVREAMRFAGVIN